MPSTFSILLFLLYLYITPASIAPVPKYISIAFIKSTSPEFIEHEKMFWVPVQKELIKACRKDSWYIYKVMSSRMPDLPFDYVRFNVFHDIEQTKNPYIGIQEFIQRVYPDKETADQLEKTNSTRFMLWEQLYEIRSKTKSWLLHPAIFLQIAPTDLTSDQQGLVGLKSLDRITEKTKWNMLSLKKVNRSSHSDYLLELVVSAHK